LHCLLGWCLNFNRILFQLTGALVVEHDRLEEKNMAERLYEYEIWFNATGTATIIIDDEKEGYS